LLSGKSRRREDLQEYATPMPRQCPQCGVENPPTAKFCAQCATQLGSAVLGAARAAAKKANDAPIRT
jgi:uncharacterized membrane protein YvbJ